MSMFPPLSSPHPALCVRSCPAPERALSRGLASVAWRVRESRGLRFAAIATGRARSRGIAGEFAGRIGAPVANLPRGLTSPA